jgi:hypothetical protein
MRTGGRTGDYSATCLDLICSLRSAQSELPKRQVVSTDRCNTGLKFTCGSFKPQSFPRALIEAQRYFVEVGENGYLA